MLDDNNSPEPLPRDPTNKRWVAMQSAYAEYTRMSEALGHCSEPVDDLCPVAEADLLRLAAEQRVAFERYLETRMEFLEYRFDEDRSAVARSAGGETRLSLRSSVTNLPALAGIVALAILSVSLFALVRSQHEVRTLKTEQALLSAALDKTRDDLQLLARKVVAVEPATLPAIHRPEPGSFPPVPVLPATKPKVATNPGWRRLSEKRTAHVYRQFSLVRSRQFRKIGPIEVSLISVDERQNSVTLSIVSGSGNLRFTHVRLNQPVWIPTSDRKKGLELIVDRIAKDGVDGRLIATQG
jgi:hypothetical protein